MPLLEVKGIKRHFGAVKACDGIDLAVPEREVRAVIGPNGAGKTTLFDVIAGRLPPTAGDVIFDGESIIGLPEHRVVRRGIGVTFQVAQVFDDLTLQENVISALLVATSRSASMLSLVRRDRDMQQRATRILEQVGLADQRAQTASVLSHGDRKALEIAIALANAPKLLLLDEPTAGMSVPERTATISLLTDLRDEHDLTIVFTEHDMDMVLAFADRISCMAQGKLLAEGTPDEIRANEDVRAAYLGQETKGTQDAAGS